MALFACRSCGSPSVSLPPDLHDEDDVHCDRCGERLSSWLEFKRHVKDVTTERSPAAQNAKAPSRHERSAEPDSDRARRDGMVLCC